ncbi:PP2C family protein-serine/threonine phosphatase [Actinoplanes lobatus]|uniref:Serine phosphatase RsbU (Regulator of sigma subunit) n=1 Tax=Actinoplanes lobatus TaxID=113568 RepID=A0A7W7HKX4_9ACTN|nr:PP2C family protein-serine/threonine phosphatase [Actinoplanes lobatus]MBB4752442.1 serine phosphatase RsbU (regulator of sigma subunit) [Actinoplanes lobatus]
MADLLRLLSRLLTASHHARPEDVAAAITRFAPLVNAREVVVYLVDYDQRQLRPLPGPEAPARAPIAVDGTLPGRAFALTEIYETRDEHAHRLWVPLLNGTERLGVLEAVTDAISDQHRHDLPLVASLLAELVMTRRAYGDAVELTRRRQPMQLAAEVLWNLLPPLTFIGCDIAVSAVLEPCYDVGGDAFDYAVNGDILRLAIFDAAGHGLDASTITSLAINAYRNARRGGLDLAEIYNSVDGWIARKHPHAFVTAVLCELNAATGALRRISAGHPAELLLRDGKLVTEFVAPTALPLGLGRRFGRSPTVTEETLQPGDRILLYTDGVIEARTLDNEFFGTARLVEFITRALADQLSAPETMRRLVHAILDYQDGQLQDDASAVLVEWQPTATSGSPPY